MVSNNTAECWLSIWEQGPEQLEKAEAPRLFRENNRIIRPQKIFRYLKYIDKEQHKNPF